MEEDDWVRCRAIDGRDSRCLRSKKDRPTVHRRSRFWKDVRLAPKTYYLTDHYVNDPCVLVRLARIHQHALGDLLLMGWRFMSTTKKLEVREAKTQMRGWQEGAGSELQGGVSLTGAMDTCNRSDSAETRAIDLERSTLTVFVYKSGYSRSADDHIIRSPLPADSFPLTLRFVVEIRIRSASQGPRSRRGRRQAGRSAGSHAGP